MRRRISRPVASAALVVYSGLMAVLCRRYDQPIDVMMLVLIVASGVCLSTLVAFIMQSEPPK